jgi:hypothetical protein
VEYQKSIFMLRRTIGAPFKMGSNTQPNRAAAKLPSWQDWNSRSIEERQAVLVKLAWKAWGIAAIGGVTEKF